MSEAAAPVPLTAKHYQAICALALVAIFLVQMQQNIELLLNLFMLGLGSWSLLYRARLNPLYVFLTIGVGQLYEQYQLNQMFNPDFRTARFMDVGDISLCMATLTYLSGQFRLQGIWFHVLPEDVRTQTLLAKQKQARSESTLTAEELLWLLMPVPLFVLTAEVLVFLLKQRWTLVGLPPRWRQFLTLTWMLLLVMFVAAHFFRYWRRLQMDRATAQILLQDLLWQETRGEQRRINHWIVWRKLKHQEETEAPP